MHDSTRFHRCLRAASIGCIAVAFLAIVPAIAEACPTCKDSIAQNDPQQQQMVKGYFYSILFMMSTPFIVVGTFGSMAYLSIKRARGNEGRHGDQEQPADRRSANAPRS